LDTGVATTVGNTIELSAESAADFAFTTVNSSSVVALANVYESVKTTAGANVVKGFTVDVAPLKGQTSGSITVSVPGVTSNNGVLVLHENSTTGTVSYAPVTAVNNGSVTFYMDSFSAVMVVVFDAPVSVTASTTYSAQSATTVSGDVSPKTVDAYPYAAAIAVFAIACVFACSKKISKN
jgi:hypothetical protein